MKPLKTWRKLRELNIYLLVPGPTKRGGGGAAILSNLKNFVVKKLDINHPKCLEVLWALARKTGEGRRENIREFILCSFYSPPQRGKHNKLVQHINENLLVLLTRYPQAGFFICGDANKLDYSKIIRAVPHCRQLVT